MNCEIQPMKGRSRDPGTLPPRGKVKEVKRDWLVHEDGALAYRLQNEEFQQHFHGNKVRNMQIREDFPCAKEEQYREAEEAARVHNKLLQQREAEDAAVAAEIARRIEKEDHERRRRMQMTDEALAKHLQDKEKERREKRERRDLEVHTPRKQDMRPPLNNLSNVASTSNAHVRCLPESNVDDSMPSTSSSNYNTLSEINNVGIPVPDQLVQSMRSCHVYGSPRRSHEGRYSPSPPPMSEDDVRRIQEEQDAELARRLQDEEPDPLDPLTRDRLLAIETQDKELARLLWEKDRARLRRAKERARAKRRAAENEHEQEEEEVQQPEAGVKPKPRYPDPDEIVSVPDPSSTVGNIAMVIDPTYPRSRPQGPSDNEQADTPIDGIVPPYMPIQGQRRFADKKPRGKDGCKQQ